jgi:hypothetical protein
MLFGDLCRCARSSVWVGLALMGCALQARAASTLNFPKLAFDNTYIGIAIANPTTGSATVRLTAYGTDGSLVRSEAASFSNPATLTIPARQQVAKLTSEIFGAGPATSTIAWFQATSDTDDLAGFFLFLNSTVTFMDGADLPPASSKFLFQQIRVGGGVTTELDIINPATTSATIQVALTGAGSAKITRSFTLVAKGVTRLDVASYFGVTDVSAGAYVEVSSSGASVAGVEFVKGVTGELLGLNGRPTSEQLDALWFPQLAVLGGYKTELGVINPSTTPVVLTITAFKQNGALYDTANLRTNPVTRTLSAGGSLREDLETMFGFTGSATLVGWVEVKATAAAVQGYLTYGVPGSGASAAVTTAAQGRTRALFSHIATSGYFTGVAALNPGSLAANVRVVALRATGTVLGSYDTVLQPGEQFAKLVGVEGQIIPEAANQNGGMIWVKSDRPVFLASVFGTPSGSVLANIPPQNAPDTYLPDTSLLSIKITPPLAVLQPRQTKTFKADGATGDVLWRVNGVLGGGSASGTVAGGVFTAPASVPTRQIVTVSAENSSQSSGASIDIVDKSAVTGGLAVVQSVAYVSSLAKLYAAEFTLLSGFSDVEAAELGNSKITEVSPAGAKIAVYSVTNEKIAKLLPFRAGDGREYLLYSAQTSGKVFRLDLTSKQTKEVVTGLTEPSAMVFDSNGNDLLIAERDRVTTVPRTQLEAGLTTTAADSGDLPPAEATIAIQGAAGLAIDRCTGKLYFTIPSGTTGSLQEYDPTTARTRPVLTNLRNPGALLGLYRAGVSCPDGFQLLLSEKGADRTLIVQRDGSSSDWLAVAGVNDFVFLPDGNPYTNQEGVALGENTALTGTLTVVKVASLYQTRPPNPVLVVTTGGANLALNFDSNSVPQSSTSCGSSPSWFFKLTVTETGGVGVTVTRILWDFYDSSGNLINNQTNTGTDFATWFDECGAGSATIGPNGRACATLCAHLGGRTSGSMALTLTVTESGTNRQLTFTTPRLTLLGSSSLTAAPEALGPAAGQSPRH